MGNYFLLMNLGVAGAVAAAGYLHPRKGTAFLLAAGCAGACLGLLFLAVAPPAAPVPAWRLPGVFLIGAGAGILNIAVFHAISPLYRRDPAATINLAGAFFGIGCVLITLLVASTFYVYTVSSILFLIALIPGFFAVSYARSSFAPASPLPPPSVKQAFADFKSPVAVLFALLLFFQFGNEWAIAGWLPLFLIQRLGISPETSLLMLAIYWLALLVGRAAVLALLPRVSHGKLLLASVMGAIFGCVILVSTNNCFGAVTGVLLVGASFAPIYPLVVEKIEGRFPYYHPGFFNGIFSFALTGGMLAPWSLGFFTNAWGIRAVMGLPLLGTIMVLALLLLIWAEAKIIGPDGSGGNAAP